MSQGMQTDFLKESQKTVAIKFPETGRPTFFRSSYNPKTWQNMIAEAHLNRNIQAIFVSEDSEEGQAILQGTDPSDITAEFLMGLEEDNLRDMAKKYGISAKATSAKKSVALKILAAIAEGIKPNAKNADNTNQQA